MRGVPFESVELSLYCFDDLQGPRRKSQGSAPPPSREAKKKKKKNAHHPQPHPIKNPMRYRQPNRLAVLPRLNMDLHERRLLLRELVDRTGRRLRAEMRSRGRMVELCRFGSEVRDREWCWGGRGNGGEGVGRVGRGEGAEWDADGVPGDLWGLENVSYCWSTERGKRIMEKKEWEEV